MAGCVLSGACQLPVFIAPWTRQASSLDLSSQPSDDASSNIQTPMIFEGSTSTDFTSFLHLQICYTSPRLHLLKTLLIAEDKRIPQLSEVSVVTNESRVDLRWEEMPLLYDLFRDFSISVEPLLLSFHTDEVRKVQEHQVSTALRCGASQVDTQYEPKDIMKELQQYVEQLLQIPELTRLEDGPGYLIEPLLHIARDHPYIYYHTIQSCLNNSTLVGDLNPRIADALRGLVGINAAAFMASDSTRLRLIRIKVSLPIVYWMIPSFTSPTLENLQEEPNSPMMLKLGKIVSIIVAP